MSINTSETPLKDITFIAFDIETTGLSPIKDRIVEVGAIKFKNQKIIDTFQELIDPKMPISPGASAVNGITDDMVLGKPTIEEILPRFNSFLGRNIPVAHNAPFDVGFLSYDISRLNLEASDRPILDTCAIPKRVFPSLFSYSLENLAYALNIKPRKFHRALADSEVCMQLFLKCILNLGHPEQITLKDVLSVNGPALCLRTGEITFEGPFMPLKEALETGDSIEIIYQDARGSITKRRIVPLSVGLFRGITMVEAFCSLRQDKRNFRLDRILEIR